MQNFTLPKFITLQFFLLIVFSTSVFSQANTNCAGADPFCTGTTYTFPNNTGTTAQAGPNYGCLTTQPNPVWYYLQIANSGPIDITMNQTSGGSGSDIDFICWGPFASQTGNCGNLTAGNTVDCSYSTAATEICNIPSAVAGQYYIICMTNFANTPGTISFSQTGGSGSTNCNILCNITAMTGNPGACNPGTNGFDVTGNISTTAPPSSGTLTIQSNCGGTPTVMNPPFATSTNYTVTGIPSTGGPCQITASYSADPSCTFTVNLVAPAPCTVTCVATANNTGPYCVGSPVTFSASGGGTYTWSGPNGFSSTSQNPTIPSAGLADAGVYTVSIANGACNATATTTVAINAYTPSPSSNGPVCEGTTLNLNCAAGVSWTWFGPNGFSSGFQNPTITPVTPAASGTYTVNSTDGNGCSGTNTVNVTINALPVVTASSSGSICPGGTGTLDGFGATSYTWSAGTTPASGSPVSATPGSTTTYTVTGTDGNGCSNTGTATLVVNTLPTINVNSSTICAGMSDTLVANGAVSYSWSAGTTPATGDSVSVTPASTTSYTVTGTDANGCVNTAIATVTINTASLPVSAGANDTICLGGNTTLTANGAVNYIWNPGTASGVSIVVTPGASTTYTVVGTDLNGCTGTDSVIVYVPATMTGTPAAANISCNAACNGTASINVTPSSGQFANYTYLWSNGATTSSLSSLCPGTYSVTVTDGGGCTITSSVVITQPAALTATASSSNILCNGGSTGAATITPVGGTPVYTYSWAPSGSGANPTNLTSGNYTVTVTDANNCNTTAQITITEPTAITANLSATSINCITTSATITSAVAGGTPAYTYSWAPSGSGSNPTVTAGGTYTLTVTDANNCVQTQTVTISSNIAPPGVSAGLDNILNCGSAANLNLNGSSSTAGVTYGWSGPSGFTSSQQNPNVTAPGTYVLVVTDPSNGCTRTDTVNITQASINAGFTANPPTGNFPLDVDFTNTSTNATNYVWDFGNGAGSFLTNDSSVYLAQGTYTVTLIASNSFGCIDTAYAVIVVTESATVLIPNVFTPNADGMNDIFFITSTGLSTLNVDIFNRWGEKISEIININGGWNGKTASGADSADGTYYYMLKASGVDGTEIAREGYMLLAR